MKNASLILIVRRHLILIHIMDHLSHKNNEKNLRQGLSFALKTHQFSIRIYVQLRVVEIDLYAQKLKSRKAFCAREGPTGNNLTSCG